MARHRKLDEAGKAFLVQRLAQFDSPKEAAAALYAEYGVEITPQAAERYDPGKYAGQRLATKWRELFDTSRERFLRQLDQIPAANKAVRLRRLDRMSVIAEQRGNAPLAAQLLKQIAEECGNVYSNRRELSGKDGKPIQIQEMTQEQVERELALLFSEAAAIYQAADSSPPPDAVH